MVGGGFLARRDGTNAQELTVHRRSILSSSVRPRARGSVIERGRVPAENSDSPSVPVDVFVTPAKDLSRLCNWDPFTMREMTRRSAVFVPVIIGEITRACNGCRSSVSKLAARYDQMITTIDPEGNVEPAALRFASWLAGWWRVAGPPEPRRLPDAVSASADGDQLLRWYVVGAEIRAYVPGGSGCFLIPLAYAEGGT
jgi:hypothetical protein